MACNTSRASATFVLSSSYLSSCLSVVVENFYRLFTPSSHLAPFTMYEADVPSNADFDLRAKATCNDIDAFLEPLMDDLIKLWMKGAKVWTSIIKNTSH